MTDMEDIGRVKRNPQNNQRQEHVSFLKRTYKKTNQHSQNGRDRKKTYCIFLLYNSDLFYAVSTPILCLSVTRVVHECG